MRRALALAAVVVISARQDSSCREDVCFYHIPKTGGDSLKYLFTSIRCSSPLLLAAAAAGK
jgi:hypothetical protein